MEFSTYTYIRTSVSVYSVYFDLICVISIYVYTIYNKLYFFLYFLCVHENFQEYQHSFTITSTAVFYAIETVWTTTKILYEQNINVCIVNDVQKVFSYFEIVHFELFALAYAFVFSNNLQHGTTKNERKKRIQKGTARIAILCYHNNWFTSQKCPNSTTLTKKE